MDVQILILPLDSWVNAFTWHPLLLPLYLSALSLLLLVLQLLWSHVFQKLTPRTSLIWTKQATTFHLVRLAGCLALVCLYMIPPALGLSGHRSEEERRIDSALGLTFAYASLLALFPAAKWHLAPLLLVSLGVYVIRDVYPLATYTLPVADAQEGWGLLGTKIAVLFAVGVVLPLVTPREYKPVDPEHPALPTAEQTASPLSLFTYSFIGPVVRRAYRDPSGMGTEQLPPLADYDAAAHLVEKAFPYLDARHPQQKGKAPRHIFFAFLRIHARKYVVMVVSLVVKMLAKFAAPVGIRQLLRYLETRGSSSPVVKPWIWILWIFFGPTLASLADHWYLFVLTKTMIHTWCLVTQLVSQHVLRMRVKDEEISGAAGTAAPVGAAGNGAGASKSHEEVEVLAPEPAPTASTSTPTPVPVPTPGTSSDTASKTTPAPDLSGKNLLGRINNLVTSDMDNIAIFPDTLLTLLYMPPMVLLCIAFLYVLLGWSAFVGLGVILLLLPIPGYVTKLMQGVQVVKMEKTDARVQLVSETMTVLRMIKLFGWERKMNDKIAQKREEELAWLWKRLVLELCNGILNFIIPALTMLATFVFVQTQTVVMKQELNASIVFSSMTVFDTLRDQLNMLFAHLGPMVTAKVSFDRLDDFLRNTELLDSFSEKETTGILSSLDTVEDRIGFKDAQFTWSSVPSGVATPSRRSFGLKIEGEVLFRPNCVNIIVGPTGSGKTSILMALLGEMHYEPTSPDSYVSLPRGGGVAYAAQESWVQNETIRENILFCSPFDEERYNNVIYQCCLEPDLQLFDAGDQTEVGEKGLTLSGGQKARITLARAMYSQAKILLLDDILAALDVHTAKWIIEKCFKGDLMKNRTVLLVTHAVALARPIADYIISMGSDGRISSHGDISETIKANRDLAKEIEQEEMFLQKAEQEIDVSESKGILEEESDGKLIIKEEREEGHVSWAAMKLFFAALGGKHPLFFFATVSIGLLLTEMLLTSQTWFLGYWASQYEDRPASSVHVPTYLGIYGSLFLLFVAVDFAGYIFYIFGAMRASRSIHKKLMNAILGTTLRWLDTTPISRVITRCTKDIGAVDGGISMGFWSLSVLTSTIIVKLGAVILFTPVFAVPGLLTAALGGWLGQVYMTAQLPIKRELSNAKAPMLGHFGTVISGLTSIRAYGAQQRFTSESLHHIDKYTRIACTFASLNRWIAIRVDLIGSLFSALLAAYLVYFQIRNAADTGFSLNMAVGFSALLLWWVNEFNAFEVQGNSLERIRGYVNIVQEPKPTPGGVPPAYWPASGEIRVNNLSAKYSSDGPQVLQDLSFKVNAGERIGIVGRTGSGKSTLTLSLLRSIFTEGEVYYDGLNTNNINLDALRSNVTIIPQIPQMLSGTLRQNLDPFDQYDDAVLHDALDSSGLYSLQKNTNEGKITLDTPISSSGSNLSIGERQILALARAIVRGSKLLILDEATSAIDHETDSVIQTSLRQRLGADVTVITVAHRLQTIMDANKIMVLDAGRIVEYDTPSTLLKLKEGKLRALVDESGDKDKLYSAAK